MLNHGPEGLDRDAFPVCVIGSGPVGLALAVDLARRGVGTLLLESGGKAALPAVQRLSAAELIDPARHDEMQIAVARRLGGSSNLWGGRCLPYDPVDFAERDFIDARWPIGLEEIQRHMAEAVEATSAGKPVFTADHLPLDDIGGAFTSNSLERWVNIQASQNIFRDAVANSPNLQVRTLSTAVDLEFTEAGAVSAVIVAHSLSGARVRVPVKRVVIAAGGIETARLLLAAQRRAPERFGGAEGALGRYYMGHVQGEIADIVFNDGATAAAFDFFVDSHGSYVRRRIAAKQAVQIENRLLNCAFWPVVPPVADPRHGSAILSAAYLALSAPPLGRLIVAESIRRRHVGPRIRNVSHHLANLVRGLPSAIRFSASFMRKRYDRNYRLPGFFIPNSGHRYGLSYHSEQIPRRDSRVWLSGQEDRLGLPSLIVDLRFSREDADSVVRTQGLLDEWLTANQLGHLSYRCAPEEREDLVLEGASHGTHQIGLTRMGDNRRDAVVNGDLRCFDSPNLFLATSGVLPTSSQANPTLTTVALSLRLAESLAGSL